MRLAAQGHMLSKDWFELRLPDAVMAHQCAFLYNFFKIKNFPAHVSDLFGHHTSMEASLLTGECAFEINAIPTTATWKFAKALEDQVIALESKVNCFQCHISGLLFLLMLLVLQLKLS